MSEQPVNLAIVDDHPMILEGLKSLWSENAHIHTFTFTKGGDLLHFLEEKHVDVVLLDIVLGDGSGLDYCKKVKKMSPETIVIGISNQVERSIIFQFLQNGGNGYILKNADAQEIVRCVDQSLSGELSLSKEVQEILLTQPTLVSGVPRLTKREQEILKAIAAGNTSADIAAMLFISVITVETHRRNLLQKFQAKNMIELVKTAMELNLL
ncbi:response regulator [Sphingobacterium psychroaquaticum]|uniref:DNA-binding response regulator, NarL/FixJ family, contains REC and HTH domains n=1 Tax=Sphingobacterium psychroaquaticum TaxID=561061 RepID=A0A1X7J0B3_9SPHI|nr:response regulator transcription factor [Sphingobacterium psychroaquaticum]SMG20910.1 DNA-binding response regulator, NarL/FixJ family, contains REC and HTH domains [Sphingobacterium psychroaquaticum]